MPRRGASEKASPADTLILGFQPPGQGEGTFALCEPPTLWCSVMAAELTHTNLPSTDPRRSPPDRTMSKVPSTRPRPTPRWETRALRIRSAGVFFEPLQNEPRWRGGRSLHSRPLTACDR